MKKCTQCGQTLSDDTKFCFKCGGSNFEQVAEAGAYQQPAPQPAQTYQQPVQTYQQPAYQQPAYQQPAYQPTYNNAEPAKIKDFLIFYLLMLIPIFNIVYFIMAAVGGPRFKVSLTNWARASLIWGAIIFVIYILLLIIFGATIASMFSGYSYY